MFEVLDNPFADSLLKLFIATLLGSIMGIEREFHRHPAGLRTHILVSLGACGFMLLGLALQQKLGGSESGVIPGRVLQGVITGVGFIGAGAIMKEGFSVHGLTTAASLWVASSIGLAIGSGLPILGCCITFFAVVTLGVLAPIHVKKPEKENISE